MAVAHEHQGKCMHGTWQPLVVTWIKDATKCIASSSRTLAKFARIAPAHDARHVTKGFWEAMLAFIRRVFFLASRQRHVAFMLGIPAVHVVLLVWQLHLHRGLVALPVLNGVCLEILWVRCCSRGSWATRFRGKCRRWATLYAVRPAVGNPWQPRRRHGVCGNEGRPKA